MLNEGHVCALPAQFDIFSKDVLLIPINHNNSHWTGAAINFRRKRIESYDSMNMDRQNVYRVRIVVQSVTGRACEFLR